jgi:hypothetical protein
MFARIRVATDSGKWQLVQRIIGIYYAILKSETEAAQIWGRVNPLSDVDNIVPMRGEPQGQSYSWKQQY